MKESLKNKKERALRISGVLDKVYPDAVCSLDAQNPYELLVSVRLSAQCTDARVNLVTPALFEKYPDIHSMAGAEIGDVEKMIHSCGFYHGKARDIVSACRMIEEKYGGVIPDTMEELLTLPGVGRKSANLILGDIYHKHAIVTDTHCIRICERLGLSEGKDPYRVEMQLEKVLPYETSNMFCHRIVLFGRDTCSARSPKCGNCPLESLCPSAGILKTD